MQQRFCYFAVVMKCPFCISLLLCCTFWLTACTGPIIIEEPEDDPGNTGENSTTQRDSVPIIHEGTYTSPYSIAEAQTLGRGKGIWIEGYIVGSVSGSMKSGCNYSAETSIASNILLADTFPTGSGHDYLYCLPVELPNGSAEREELNLYDNPSNHYRKLRVQGNLAQYFKVVGMKNIFGHKFLDENEDEDKNQDESDSEDNDNGGYDEEEDQDDNKNEEDNPEKPHDPDATRSDTLSIAKGIELQNRGEQPYIRGYIVGYYNGSSPVFNPTTEQISSRASNNVILADNIEETDWRNVIIVELPTQTALRSKVNLKDNPENLHRMLTVKGMLMSYKDTDYHGCMETLSGLGQDESYYFRLE